MEENNETTLVDMHIHSSHSDGHYSPEKIAEICGQLNVQIHRIADHDTVKGHLETTLNSTETKIKKAALEISTFNGMTIHLLGYFPEIERKKLEQLEQELQPIQQQRSDFTRKLIEEAHEKSLWMHIDYEALENKVRKTYDGKTTEPGKSAYVGSMQLAKEFLYLGYVDDINKGLQLLKREGTYREDQDHGYLNTIKGIELLKKYEAQISLAHPHRIKLGEQKIEEEFMNEMIKQGIDAIEIAFGQTQEQKDRYINLARKAGIKITAGNDYHHPDKEPHRQIGTNIEEKNIDLLLVNE